MFSRIFCFGKKKQALPAQEKEGSLLLKDFSPEKDLGVRSFDAQVVPLRSPENEAALKKKKESSELFSEAVNKLVDKLEGINSNLDRQIQQNEQLVLKMETLPELLGSLPQAVDRQERIFDEISLQMRQKMAQDEKTAKELSGIHEKVTACAEMDAKMSEHFGAFTRSLTKLDDDTLNQTEWIQHLNRSFSSNEQFLRDSLGKQQIRFYWLFGVSLAVSLLTMIALVIAIFFLVSR
jgi:regulator of replication initiation timing